MKGKSYSVYVAESSLGVVKIGISANSAQRMRSLRLASGVPVELRYETGKTPDAAIVERAAHTLLADKRAHGEWFQVTAEEAVAAVKRAIDDVDAYRVSRKQINIRADDEFLTAIGEIQRASTSALCPSIPEVIRAAVFEQRDRIRKENPE